MRTLVKKILLSRGMVVSRPPGQFDVLSVKLERAKARGLRIGCAVDGGAADGGWTEKFKEVFPDATVVCVEPRADAQPALREVARRLPGVHVAQTLLGPSEGSTEFHDHGHQSSTLPNSRGLAFGKTVTLPMTTLDALIAKLKLPWPDLIKLDLQGFELDALRGAGECMKHASALLVEIGFFQFQKGAPIAGDVVCFLRDHGYRMYDVAALWHRPLDGALAQGDFLFLRDGHPLVADNRWSADSEFS
ncbi:MAG: FkbM family methyltransferase [Tepidisphaeraceae bacterium]